MKFFKIFFLSAFALSLFFGSTVLHNFHGISPSSVFAAADGENTTNTETSTSTSNTEIELLAPFPGQGTTTEEKDANGNTVKKTTLDIKDETAIGILGKYISGVFKFGVALVSIFAVIMLMLGGFEYMTAGGESSKADNAKTRIAQALLGLVLVFLSALLLNFINPNFFKLLP